MADMPFVQDEFASKIRLERYGAHPEETWTEHSKRIAWHVASNSEKQDKIKDTAEAYESEIVTNRFCPGGRIQYGAARPKGQMLNCYVVGCDYMDSREGWGKVVSDSIVISGTGGGIGFNFSPIRPRGTEIRGHSGKATGAVSLMDVINSAGEVIRAGGGRRTALMLCLNHDHPDTMEFIHKKLDLKQLNNANVSVVFMNESPGDFLKKVKNDELHNFIWQGNVIGSMPARELWNIILDNAINCGEPGILNGWLANEENNLWYHTPLISTNPCGEIWLEKYGCCDLGALVLPRFISSGGLDKKLLARSIYRAVRFLDGVLDANNYPLKEIEENCKSVRRIGLGVMGLHDAMILAGKKYSSEEGLMWVDSLMSFIKNKAYEASIELAIEKGQFPALDRAKFVESGFCKRALKTSLKEKILLHGIRNCANLTIAPTGTTALESMVTSGIEPIYAVAQQRMYWSGSKEDFAKEVVLHPLFAQYKDDPSKEGLFESALELTPENHMAMQAICQRHIDNAVSKTINLPKDFTGREIGVTIEKYIDQLKGLTMYRDGSRGESPITPLSYEEAIKLQACPGGICDIN